MTDTERETARTDHEEAKKRFLEQGWDFSADDPFGSLRLGPQESVPQYEISFLQRLICSIKCQTDEDDDPQVSGTFVRDTLFCPESL